MGAYNSTRHAVTGFSPYLLTRGTEMAIPLTLIYPEIATQSFESLEAYVDCQTTGIHDLVRRNTHQAQQRLPLINRVTPNTMPRLPLKKAEENAFQHSENAKTAPHPES